MRDLLMENNIKIKHIALAILAFIIAASTSKAQSTYQKYDSVTRGVEYNISKSKITSNTKEIDLLKSTKDQYSVFKESKTRSQIRAVISAKENENFRLNQKAFLLMDANKVDDVDKYNSSYRSMKPTLEQNK